MTINKLLTKLSRALVGSLDAMYGASCPPRITAGTLIAGIFQGNTYSAGKWLAKKKCKSEAVIAVRATMAWLVPMAIRVGMCESIMVMMPSSPIPNPAAPWKKPPVP